MIRRASVDLLVVLGCGALACLLVVLLSRAAPAPTRARFDARPLERLKKQRPQVVLIGNSMVYTRFDRALLDRLVRPTRTAIQATGGSKTAIWYAQLKYYVVASKIRPTRVVLFFREKELTQPRMNTTGEDKLTLEQSVPGEPVRAVLRSRPRFFQGSALIVLALGMASLHSVAPADFIYFQF